MRMSEQEENRASLEQRANRASTRLSETIDALESKAEHAKEAAKEAGAKSLKLIGAVAAATFAMKELLDWLARRRKAERERADLVRKVVLPAPLVVVTTTAAVLYWIRRVR